MRMIDRQGEKIHELEQQLAMAGAASVEQMQAAVNDTHSSLNSFNFERIAAYTHKAFVQPFATHARTVFDLLDRVLRAAPRMQRAAEDKREPLITQALARIYAAIMQTYDAEFVWEYAMGQAVDLRTVTKSTLVTDYLAATCPGSPTACTLTRRLDEWTTFVNSCGTLVDPTSTALLLQDNCPGGTKGTYVQGTSRGGDEQKRVVTVATAMGAQHFAKFSPKSDLALMDVPEEDLMFHRPSDAEKELFMTEVMGILRERLALALPGISAAAATASSTPGRATAAAQPQLWNKECGHCGKIFPNVSMRKWKCSPGGCGNPLKVVEVQAVTPASTLRGTTNFNEPAERQHKQAFKSFDCGSSGGGTDEMGGVESKMDVDEEGGSRDEEDVYMYDVLPVIMENPNTEGAIAVCLKWLDDNRADTRFGNLRYVLSGGHEAMAYQKVVLKLLMDAGYDLLAPAFNFKSLNAVRCLFGGFDNHICNDFVDQVTRRAALDVLAEQFLDSNLTERTAEAFYAWILENREHDKHFRSHTLLCLEVLTAYSMVIKGMRLCRKDVHDAGRKMLLPLCIMLRHRTYTRAVVRDLFEYGVACSPEVREDRIKHFSIGSTDDNKECPDFHMEHGVGNLKRFLTQDTPFGFQVAAAMSKIGPSLRHMIFREAGKKPPRTEQPRTQPALGRTLKKAKAAMRSVKPFAIVPGRKEVRTLDGREALDPATDVNTLLSNGDCGIECYIRSGFTDMPPGITLRTQRKIGKPDAVDGSYDADQEQAEGLDAQAEARAEQQEEQEEQEQQQEQEMGAAGEAGHMDA
ncbi:hypothetical protein B484DRAFT_390681 [Ochromonadaceae sp. CCMP2298]|nr:hypothetical protein B484DRAFT_390681 [Ochromonadaceae sp. CCMP2298]